MGTPVRLDVLIPESLIAIAIMKTCISFGAQQMVENLEFSRFCGGRVYVVPYPHSRDMKHQVVRYEHLLQWE